MMKSPYIESYIQFPTGRLTLLEVQQIFSTIPFEVDLIDHTDHFSWFSNKPNREHVRSTKALGEHVQTCHPAKAWPIVKKIIDSFKDGTRDSVSRPLTMNGHRVFIQYFALRDVDGEYLGTIEFTGSAEPILQAFEAGGWSDSSTGASQADGKTGLPDATSGASEEEAEAPVVSDASTSASQHPNVGVASDAGDQAADADSGASESDETGPFPDSGQTVDGMTGASEY
jgi:hypothetical protein